LRETINEMEVAKRMGFRYVRSQDALLPSTMEKLLPFVEELGLHLAIELHGPWSPSTPVFREYYELFERLHTDALGIVPDFSAFASGAPEICLNCIPDGCCHKDLLLEINDLYTNTEIPEKELEEKILQKGGDEVDVYVCRQRIFSIPKTAKMGTIYYRTSPDYEGFRRLLKYSKYMHGKFYYCNENLECKGIDYPRFVKIMKEEGYSGYIASEYEGGPLRRVHLRKGAGGQAHPHAGKAVGRMMTEEERIFAGVLYAPGDAGLKAMKLRSHNLSQKFNALREDEAEERMAILKQILGSLGEGSFLQGPVFFHYGLHTKIGARCFFNYNTTIQDDGEVTIGDDNNFGPNLTIVTPVHPMLPDERRRVLREDGTEAHMCYAKPVKIGSNCWFGANVVVCPGVTVGDNAVIGAGSVVTRDIPADSFAAGVPCKVIRAITAADTLNNMPGVLSDCQVIG
jgi:maltose O-acetyltransferase